MKILLVQVPTSHMGAKERVYPLGLARLSSLIPSDFEKHALDMNLHADPWPVLKKMAEDFQPDIVMLSFRNLDPLAGHQTSYLSSLKTSARMIRILVPNAGIWAGGPAFSLFAERLMEEITDIDMGLKGEGETVVPRMLADPSRARDLPGVVWRDNEKIRGNSLGEKIDMDILPRPDFKAFPPEAYLKSNMYVAAMGIEGKRGCDLNCGYCIYPSLGGHFMRVRSPINIVNEMELMHKSFGVKLFHFTDSVLNRPADHFEAVCREIINRKLDFQWTGFFREDCLSASQCDLAVRAGLSAIYFSGDSLTRHGLELLGKRLTKADLFRASRATVSAGVLTMCHFLVNLPGEFPEHETEARDTLERILEIHQPAGNLGAVILNTVRIYPDAPLTRRMFRKGWIVPGADLLYPIYYNPLATSHVLHRLEARCHAAGVLSHLGMSSEMSVRERKIFSP